MSFKSPYRMFPWMRAARDAAMGGVAAAYADKVLSYGPIAYWPLWETAGLTAECLVNSPAQDGTYAGVTLANGTGPDGSPCPLFDGINDLVDVDSAALDAAFSGLEGSLSAWFRVFNAGVWTDATTRWVCRFSNSAPNEYVITGRTAVNNQFHAQYQAGGIYRGPTTLLYGGSVTWNHIGLTWSDIADAYIFYINGGSPIANTMGTWASVSLDNAWWGAGGGAYQPWYGWLSHCALWDTALSAAAIADLATA